MLELKALENVNLAFLSLLRKPGKSEENVKFWCFGLLTGFGVLVW